MTPLPEPMPCEQCGAALCDCSRRQFDLAARCGCGRPVLDDAQVLDAVEEVSRALRSRTTFIPDAVRTLLREVSGAMACRLGRCGGEG